MICRWKATYFQSFLGKKNNLPFFMTLFLKVKIVCVTCNSLPVVPVTYLTNITTMRPPFQRVAPVLLWIRALPTPSSTHLLQAHFPATFRQTVPAFPIPNSFFKDPITLIFLVKPFLYTQLNHKITFHVCLKDFQY